MLSALKNLGELPTEIEEGNIEYKLKIKNFDEKNEFDRIRITKLASQMKWRLSEGKQLFSKNIATYIIGITNSGKVGDQTEEQIDISIKNLVIVASKCKSTIVSINKEFFVSEANAPTSNNYCVAEIIIQTYDDKFVNEMRICLFGLSNSGKTTLISHMCSQHYDNGNGSGRNTIMRHTHEQIAGTTSSICHELIGYNSSDIINYKTSQSGSWEKIVNTSDFIVSLIDLPGQQKYMKTTLYGLLSRKPHLCIYTISIFDYSSNISQIKQNFELLHHLGIKIVVIFTKFDLIGADYFVISEFIETLSQCINIPNIKFTEFTNFSATEPANIIYYTVASSVTGEGYQTLHEIFNSCYQNNMYNKFDPIEPTHNISADEGKNEPKDVKFLLGETYTICNEFSSSHEVNIASGLLISGTIEIDKVFKIGSYNGPFCDIKIKNIHKKQIDSSTFYANEYGSLELEFVDSNDTLVLNNHMILVDNIPEMVQSCKIKILFGIEFVKLKKPYSLYFDNNIEQSFVSDMSQIDNKIIEIKFSNIQAYIPKNTKCILKAENYIIGIII